MKLQFVSLFALALTAAPALHAEIRLPKILSSQAVLQRDVPMHVWGWAEPGENVSATLDGKTQSGTADRLGHWSIYLPPHAAGGPFAMSLTGANKLVLEDLLIGDVWFASGQSNMEMPLSGFPNSAVVTNAAEEIKNASHPDMRLLFVPHNTSAYPLQDFNGEVTWTPCTPETAAKFSAVAYFFGRDLAAREHVPIGLIDSTWGGTPAESWVSMDGLGSDAALMPVFAAYAEVRNEQTTQADRAVADKRDDDEAVRNHAPKPSHPWHGDPSSWTPSWLFNGMVAPAIPYGIKGAIWYQGESNSAANRAPLYERLFPALITDWRTHWQQGEFPFLFVQIANFGAGPVDLWPLVREAQRRTLSLTKTAMAVTIDIGDVKNIHPPDKQSVGARLAGGARAIAYGENISYTGPLFERISHEGNSLRVWFKGTEGALVAKGGTTPNGFEIAGADKHFVAAQARLADSSILVTSPQVPRPQYVRYGWQNAPALGLFDSAGLPASPFTSEETPTGK